KRGETVQGKSHEGKAGMGCVKLFFRLLNDETFHGFHLPDEFIVGSKIAQLSNNIKYLQQIKIRILNLLSRIQVQQ
ncbi:MAG: hypothetical protein ABI480_18185, partial [Chitinophagaceae bacterium]